MCADDVLNVFDILWSEWFVCVNEGILCMLSIFDWYMFVRSDCGWARAE